MVWAAYSLTGSRGAAWLAGAVYCLSPYFTEYDLEVNMLPAASIPVALVVWVDGRTQWVSSDIEVSPGPSFNGAKKRRRA